LSADLNVFLDSGGIRGGWEESNFKEGDVGSGKAGGSRGTVVILVY
jgi:hypothetical protein